MNTIDKDQLDAQKIEQLKKEQKSIRKTGIILFLIAVLFAPIASAIHFGLVGISGVLATIGGFLIARSYVHVKYQNLDQQK